MRPALIPLCLSLFLAATPAGAGVGVIDTRLTDRADRPLSLRLWYPTETKGPGEPIGENPIFVGYPALRNAPAVATPAPFILISHGSGGNLTNQGWLASALASQGMIVATLNHPGTTTGDNRPPTASRLWERPQDIQRVIDAALAPTAAILPPGAKVDPQRIGVIGHSLGAFTALWIAGARFDPVRFAAHCREKPHFAACRVAADYQLPQAAPGQTLLSADHRDARVRAFVALDIGLANAFSPESLAAITRPVLLVPADQPNPQLPPLEETGYVHTHLAPTVRAEFGPKGASHFSFMPICKPGAGALLAAEAPDDVIVCQDGPGADRASLHQQVIDHVTVFLKNSGF